jgi:hypothetical protein
MRAALFSAEAESGSEAERTALKIGGWGSQFWGEAVRMGSRFHCALPYLVLPDA